MRTPFLHLLTLLLFKERKKHLGVVILSVLVVFLLSSMLLYSFALQSELKRSIEAQPDFTLSKMSMGKKGLTPLAWGERIASIAGVSDVTPRLYGRYFFQPKQSAFLVMGIDFFEKQNNQALASLLQGISLRDFLAEPSMLVGEGVFTFLQAHYFKEHFTFKTPTGHFKEVRIAQVLPRESNFMGSDVIIMPLGLAQEIFGVEEGMVSDFTFNVPNDAEWRMVKEKLHLRFDNIQIVTKKEILKGYEHLFNERGGLFLMLYLVTFITFMMILYQRYAMVYYSERREIGILRAVGWSIADVLRLKFYENMLIVVVSFLLGVLLAYGYVFLCDAPLLEALFLGSGNLPNHFSLHPQLPFGVLVSLWLIFAIPFLTAVLIPAWRIGVTSPKEAML
jgi:ABC-type lipoprotein release transport system permease subunit